jgi:hypothetical protein
MEHPEMDVIHKQVVVALYSIQAEGRLDEYRRWLRIYLGVGPDKLAELLTVIERAGIIDRSDSGVRLVHELHIDTSDSCGHMH